MMVWKQIGVLPLGFKILNKITKSYRPNIYPISVFENNLSGTAILQFWLIYLPTSTTNKWVNYNTDAKWHD